MGVRVRGYVEFIFSIFLLFCKRVRVCKRYNTSSKFFCLFVGDVSMRRLRFIS